MTFKEIKKKRLYEDVLIQLQDHLLNSGLDPGEKLPSERNLAARFHVSRVAVREALTVLESNGLVERKVGGGTFRTGPGNFSATSLAQVVSKNQHLIKEPMQVRRLIEPHLARLAAVNITEKQLERLNDILQRQKDRFGKGQEFIDLDCEFHHTIAEATGNSILVGLIEALHGPLSPSRVMSHRVNRNGDKGYSGHKAVYDALLRRDPDKAETAMLEHILSVECAVMEYLAQSEREK